MQSNFYIPESYIEDVRQRVELYKNFEKTQSREELLSLVEDLKDRFGTMPKEVEDFIKIEKIRILAQMVGFVHVVQIHNNKIELHLGDKLKIPAKNLLVCLEKFSSHLTLPNNIGKRLYIKIQEKNKLLDQLIFILENMLKLS